MFQGLKIPANSMSVVDELMDLSSFDLVSTDYLDELIYYWPEIGPFSVNFE